MASGTEGTVSAMPTDKERREVAENLRNMCACECRYEEEFYNLLVETVMRAWDFHEFSDVADRLAELIEPEERTCRKVPGRMKYGVRRPMCSECGYSLGDERWLFCPKCGAKVVCDA